VRVRRARRPRARATLPPQIYINYIYQGAGWWRGYAAEPSDEPSGP
jgi:hypothetical protein